MLRIDAWSAKHWRSFEEHLHGHRRFEPGNRDVTRPVVSNNLSVKHALVLVRW